MWSCKDCLCFARSFRRRQAALPPEVKEAFEAYSDGDNHMGPDQFLFFTAEAQGVAGATHVDRVQLQRFLHHLHRRPFRTPDDFCRHYLFSDELNPAIRTQVHQEMTAPLSHYYIYTGHNSYLTGNQFNSKCSELPIITALQRGVKAIELDLWPNSTKDNVRVFHGRYFQLSLKIFTYLLLRLWILHKTCNPAISFDTLAILEVVDDVIMKV